jgi:hypothetical protein
MAADWETLGSDYQASSSVLIAEVDCTLVSVASLKTKTLSWLHFQEMKVWLYTPYIF